VAAALWVLIGAAMMIAAVVWAIVEERDHRWNTAKAEVRARR
jgi:hypothetical protein